MTCGREGLWVHSAATRWQRERRVENCFQISLEKGCFDEFSEENFKAERFWMFKTLIEEVNKPFSREMQPRGHFHVPIPVFT